MQSDSESQWKDVERLLKAVLLTSTKTKAVLLTSTKTEAVLLTSTKTNAVLLTSIGPPERSRIHPGNYLSGKAKAAI
jgi:hypothetical protein